MHQTFIRFFIHSSFLRAYILYFLLWPELVISRNDQQDYFVHTPLMMDCQRVSMCTYCICLGLDTRFCFGFGHTLNKMNDSLPMIMNLVIQYWKDCSFLFILDYIYSWKFVTVMVIIAIPFNIYSFLPLCYMRFEMFSI